jgi:DNA modification methylase
VKVKLINADVLAGLAMLPDESVHCCVTSPPYWGLRDYGVEGQIGLEPTIEEFVARMVEVFREVRRVLRGDGVLWLNLGDTYAGSNHGSAVSQESFDKLQGNPHIPVSKGGKRATSQKLDKCPAVPSGLKPKDLCGVPWRVALALQADGWYLRSDIIWAKPNPMPESCTDRPTTAHEHIFLLTKSAKYFYDAEAVREKLSEATLQRDKSPRGRKQNGGGSEISMQGIAYTQELGNMQSNPSGRNLRSVWTIATAPFPSAHFATFPPAIPERCIKAGTSERGCCPKCGSPWLRVVEKRVVDYSPSPRSSGNRDRNDAEDGRTTTTTTTGWTPTCACDAGEAIPCTVLDPFGGAMTTSLVAAKLGRDSISIELNPSYVEMGRKRITGEMGMLVEIERN